VQRGERALVEAGPDLADVAQTARVEGTEEKRSEVRSRAARRGEAADHQLLGLANLDLEPLSRSAGAVGRRRILGDQPSKPFRCAAR
jgi:hypothetical protein